MAEITCVRDYEEKAKKNLDKNAFGYFVSGADGQITLKNNILAYGSIRLRPRVLRNISNINLQTRFLGNLVDLPFGIAPFAMQKLLHPDGELLTSKQAKQRNVPFTLSMLSTTSINTIQSFSPDSIKILQLYILKNTQYTERIVQTVQKQGYKAIALTVDTQAFGKRRTDERNKFNPNVTLEIFKQLNIDIRFRSNEPSQSFIHNLDNNISWEKVKWLKSISKIPIILKGVAHAQDAIIADQIGIDAIWISNHGGRQLDTSPATITVLKQMKAALKKKQSKMAIYIDGGIKKGSDIFKCLALGADYVFIGRGFLYSLVDGSQGIKNSFQMLKQQLTVTMQLCGTTSISEITQQYVEEYPSSKL